ncbi:MAG: nucleotidyltransferase [bacterium]
MNHDLIELLAAFNDHGVEFIVVGAHALAAHGHVRATKDLDLWIRPSLENASRAMHALAYFGAPLHDLTREDLATPGTVYQIGVPPLRVDVLTTIDGVRFDDAWSDRVTAHFDGVDVSVLSRSHLIQNKRASGRLQDLADVEWLERGADDF